MAKLIRVWDGTVWQSVGSALPNALTIDGTQTLTNKTISGANNTLTNIPNNALTNSSITVNGSAVSLGGSVTIVTGPTSSIPFRPITNTPLAMMELLPKQFSELLTANELTAKLVTYFLNLISSNKIDATKKDLIIPLNWLESKATNMRVRALENTLQLQPDFQLTCQVVEQKQLVFSQIDKKTDNFVA